MLAFAKQKLLGIVAGALMLPGAIAAATVFLFLTSPAGGGSGAQWDSALNRTGARCCFFGSLIGIGFCVLLGIVFCRRFSRADSACPTAYDQIRQGLAQVKQRLAEGCGDPAAATVPAPCVQAAEHVAYLENVVSESSQAGLPWFLGTGTSMLAAPARDRRGRAVHRADPARPARCIQRRDSAPGLEHPAKPGTAEAFASRRTEPEREGGPLSQ